MFCYDFCLQQGYAVINLEALNPSEVEDICLSKFLTSVVQVKHYVMFGPFFFPLSYCLVI